MKVSVLDFTPKLQRVFRIEVTGNPQDFVNLMDDLSNCYDLGIELKEAFERVL